MQAPQSQKQPPGLFSVGQSLWQTITLVLGIATVVLAVTQNLELEYSAKEIRTKINYHGNLLIDLKKIAEK